MLVYSLLIIISIYTKAYADSSDDHDCIEQVNQFQSCVDHRIAAQKELIEADRNNQTVDGLHCFKKNKCKEPTKGDIAKSTPPPKKVEKEDNGPDAEKRRECFQMIADMVKDDVEQCVQKKLTDFRFPKKSSQRTIGNEGSEHQGFNFGAMVRLVDDFCPEGEKKAAKSCLDDAFENSRTDEERMKEAEKHFKQSCKDRDECFDKVSAKCKPEYNVTKKFICECAKTEYEDKKDKFQKEFNDCIGIATLPPAIEDAPAKTAAYYGDGAEFLVTSMCHQRDPCEGGFKHKAKLLSRSKKPQQAQAIDSHPKTAKGGEHLDAVTIGMGHAVVNIDDDQSDEIIHDPYQETDEDINLIATG